MIITLANHLINTVAATQSKLSVPFNFTEIMKTKRNTYYRLKVRCDGSNNVIYCLFLIKSTVVDDIF